MVTNWAQLLVHDNAALAQFRANHRIPNDVQIERLGPNDNVDWVEGEGKDLYLSDFIRVSGQWEFQDDDPRPYSLSGYIGYIPIVNNCQKMCNAVDLLCYTSLYHLTIPYRGDHRIQPNLAPLHIRRRLNRRASIRSSRVRSDSSSNWDVDLGLGEEEEDEDTEVEDGEGVNQIKVPAPVPTPAIALLTLSFGRRAHTSAKLKFRIWGSEGEEDMAPRDRALGKNRATEEMPMKLALDLDLALLIPAELPQDVVDLTTKDLEGFRDRLVMMGARARVDLAASEQAVVNARNEAKAAIEEKNKALQDMAELQKVSSEKS
ncbi:hypothetical protein Acr_28g0006970 [Actinidia rufa]|uniref:Uncharacterized protein n=1 Tax=Actinidia rufa TaxID=165716 RepID=A0A7J0HA43_9ERIC|nr:hypothetical protein Acr_28g0006970 [Actinidia rufa]